MGCIIGGLPCQSWVQHMHGSNVKPSKLWLIVKAEHCELAKKIFAGCDVGITAEGKRYLGAAIGSQHLLRTT